MATPIPETFQGGTITFSSGFISLITNVNWSNITRAAIPTSTGATTVAKTFKPANLFDPGTLSIDIQFDANTKPPIEGTVETITVTFPPATTGASSWSASGFMQDFAFTGPVGENEDLMTATTTLKFTGDITQAAIA